MDPIPAKEPAEVGTCAPAEWLIWRRIRKRHRNTLSIQGRASSIDADGEQTIEATLTPGGAGASGRQGADARSSGSTAARAGKLHKARQAGLAWLLHEFSVRSNRNNHRHLHYYLYGLEGANLLVETQVHGAGLAQACMAILFPKQSAPPVAAITGSGR